MTFFIIALCKNVIFDIISIYAADKQYCNENGPAHNGLTWTSSVKTMETYLKVSSFIHRSDHAKAVVSLHCDCSIETRHVVYVTLATYRTCKLAEMGIVHNSWCRIAYKSKTSFVKLNVVQDKDKDYLYTDKCTAFNIGIHERSDVDICSVVCADLETSCRRIEDQKLRKVHSMKVAQIRQPECTVDGIGKRNLDPTWIQLGMKEYFQQDRILHAGDVFEVKIGTTAWQENVKLPESLIHDELKVEEEKEEKLMRSVYFKVMEVDHGKAFGGIVNVANTTMSETSSVAHLLWHSLMCTGMNKKCSRCDGECRYPMDDLEDAVPFDEQVFHSLMEMVWPARILWNKQIARPKLPVSILIQSAEKSTLWNVVNKVSRSIGFHVLHVNHAQLVSRHSDSLLRQQLEEVADQADYFGPCIVYLTGSTAFAMPVRELSNNFELYNFR